MKIEIKLADDTSSYIIKNMYPLYLHDLSELHGTLPNQHGIFEDGDVKTLADQYDIQQPWFEHPGVLFPYLIMVDDIPAGFCLVATGRFVPPGSEIYIYETFLLKPFRGKSISYQAVIDIFNRHRGEWMLYTNATENNYRAQLFWCKTLGSYTQGNYRISVQNIDHQPKLVFQFIN
ncbi:MAG: hypothetical protein K0S47_3508 [Herbinix sp.]|jgi:predicted acetyltransferase|nr:hypothetical protein [Herbinix sp.]